MAEGSISDAQGKVIVIYTIPVISSKDALNPGRSMVPSDLNSTYMLLDVDCISPGTLVPHALVRTEEELLIPS